MRKLETVDRALQLLQVFTHHGQELTVGALAATMGIHRSSVSRLAGTLAERGFLERSPGGDAFRLGAQLVRLGMLALASRDLVSAAYPPMARLAERTGETTVLSVLDDGEAVDVAQVDGPHLVSARQWIGRRSPLHASSDGKVLLAFADAASRRPRSALTSRTVTGERALRAQVERVRAQGWASAVGELEDGLNGVSAPVRDHLGHCIAAISISGPEYRLLTDRLSSLAQSVQTTAAEVSGTLGHATDPART